MWGSTKRRLQDLPRMLNAAIRTARSFTGRLADGDVEVVGDGLAPLVARGYAHGSPAGYRNGIEEVITRPDLADRSIFLTLPPVADARRQPERELWRQFEVA